MIFKSLVDVQQKRGSYSGYNRIKKRRCMFLTAVPRAHPPPKTLLLPSSLHSVTNDERKFSFSFT